MTPDKASDENNKCTICGKEWTATLGAIACRRMHYAAVKTSAMKNIRGRTDPSEVSQKRLGALIKAAVKLLECLGVTLTDRRKPWNS